MASRRRTRKRDQTRPAAARPAAEVAIPTTSTRAATLLAAACVLVALAIYVATLSPTVVGGDSGELIVAARVSGVVHPPGYPLHTLLAKTFSRLPLGPGFGFRVNLLSAVSDALAAGLLCWAVALWTRRPWSGVFSAALFAFSPMVWPYAVTAEVFALNNLFAAGLVVLTVCASLAPQPWLLPAACFWLGLGLTNHHTLVFFGAPALAFMAFLEPSSMTARRITTMIACFSAALLPYAYLPIAAAAYPPATWGDPASVSGFVTHLLRLEYGTFRLASAEVGTGGSVFPRIGQFVTQFAVTTGFAGLILAVVGVAVPSRDARATRLAYLWAATLITYLVVFSALANVSVDIPLHVTVQERFWQQAVVVASALAGVGLANLATRLGTVGSVLPAGAALVCTLALVLVNFGAMDQRQNWLFRDYGRAVLTPLPQNAILLITSDEAVGSVRYAQWVEGLRQDVRVITTGQITSPWFRAFAAHRLPEVVLPPGEFSARQFMDANVGPRTVFLVNKLPWLQSLEEGYHPWPIGLADRVLPGKTPPDIEAWVREATEGFARFDASQAAKRPQGTWERSVADAYWEQYRRFARAVVTAAAPHDTIEMHRALVAALQPLADRDPAPEPTLFKNLGAAYQHLRNSDAVAGERMARYWRAYLAMAPNDPDAPAMRTLIDATAVH